jgi:hypothetical protein
MLTFVYWLQFVNIGMDSILLLSIYYSVRGLLNSFDNKQTVYPDIVA